MKTKALLALFNLCIMVLIQSCSNEQEPMAYGDSTESEATISHMVVKFEDRIYETDAKVIGDSVTYLNQEYADVYNSKISKLPELATIMTIEGAVIYIEYLASQEDVEEKYNFLKLEADSICPSMMATRSKIIDMWPPNTSAVVLGQAALFDDRDFKDTILLSYATTTWFTSIPRLKNLGFNDKCSSIKVHNTMDPICNYTVSYLEVSDGLHYMRTFKGNQLRPVLVSYWDSDYKGKILYCIAPATGSSQDHMDYNLKNIGWNDKISAIEWVLVYDFTKFMGDHPDLPHASC